VRTNDNHGDDKQQPNEGKWQPLQGQMATLAMTYDNLARTNGNRGDDKRQPDEGRRQPGEDKWQSWQGQMATWRGQMTI